jgi:hypothetical protein
MSVITSGNGTQAGVTSVGRQMVHNTRNDSEIDQILNGWAFTIAENTVTPTGANDFLVLANISADPMVVTRVALTDAGAEVLNFSLADNYTIAGTNAAPDAAYNRSGSSNALSTKCTARVGVTVTGTGTAVQVLTFTTGAGTVNANVLGTAFIVVPAGQSLTIGAETGTAAITDIAIDCHFLMEPRVNL